MIELINETVEEIRQMLVLKNRAYGNSALDPVRIFSKSDPIEQLKVRIDDKISRVMKGNELAGEATIDDMIGYLVLLKIARRIEDAEAAARIGGNQAYAQPQHLNGGFRAAPAYQPTQQPGAGYGAHVNIEAQHPDVDSGDLLDNLADGLSDGLDRWYAEQGRPLA